jgi:hypothetical protein
MHYTTSANEALQQNPVTERSQGPIRNSIPDSPLARHIRQRYRISVLHAAVLSRCTQAETEAALFATGPIPQKLLRMLARYGTNTGQLQGAQSRFIQGGER